MSPYVIKRYSYAQAKKLGVTIKPSMNLKKKIDVFNKEGKKLVSIGDIRYKDYPTFLREDGKQVADKRRKSYKARHEATAKKVGSPSYYAYNILW